MTLLLLAALAAAATAFVLQPLFVPEPTTPREADRAVLRLVERRDQLLLALAELDFERDAGKIAPGEHEASRARVLAEAAAVTARLDELGWKEGRPR